MLLQDRETAQVALGRIIDALERGVETPQDMVPLRTVLEQAYILERILQENKVVGVSKPDCDPANYAPAFCWCPNCTEKCTEHLYIWPTDDENDIALLKAKLRELGRDPNDTTLDVIECSKCQHIYAV